MVSSKFMQAVAVGGALLASPVMADDVKPDIFLGDAPNFQQPAEGQSSPLSSMPSFSRECFGEIDLNACEARENPKIPSFPKESFGKIDLGDPKP
ncbi:MAG: hypothetical protein MRY79_03130 [Alphaproteobacteria bacterium]|nr:hypothetical protein [Alphaproteobacteria bacterium]